MQKIRVNDKNVVFAKDQQRFRKLLSVR